VSLEIEIVGGKNFRTPDPGEFSLSQVCRPISNSCRGRPSR
jgi:hypothetical protein